MVVGVCFEQHRNNNNRLIFTKPRGKTNKFNPDIVDNYIGEMLIVVKFEDGDIRYYTIEHLLTRIIISKQHWLKGNVFKELICKSKDTGLPK